MREDKVASQADLPRSQGMQNNQLSPNQALPRAEQAILRRVGSLPCVIIFTLLTASTSTIIAALCLPTKPKLVCMPTR